MQANIVQKAGAAGLILVNSNNTGFFNINPDSSSNVQISIPVLGMPRLPAIPIFRSLLASAPLTGVLRSLTLPSGQLHCLTDIRLSLFLYKGVLNDQVSWGLPRPLSKFSRQWLRA